ncbi:sensor domain-containing diguanylate cyclase [Colwellia sp. MB02u-9]|uniref:sensor domain-containing diguanylate cyclase n=1 Tax=Colwellia sp. MB02u-9 TaxID=2759823 RepID=UPI0015F5FCBA|nr:sensor domain-containing diguanylate cyclase [Colwellia sp. MB02u-9]MBA6296022.1 diguanylate cyclase [Colwellia sp. MB02u-9]
MIYFKDAHPLGKINHIPRIVATMYALSISVQILGANIFDIHYIWIIPLCLLWPHLALTATNLSANGRKQEEINMHLDALFACLMILVTPIYSFTSTMITLLIANALFVGGFRAMLTTLLVMITIFALAFAILPELHFLDEEYNTIITSSFFLLIYLCSFALTVFRLTHRLIKLNKKVKTLSVTDPLTGCYNRLYLDNNLAKELQRTYRFKNQVTVLFADLDHFKKINDQQGHNTGDRVLKKFVQIVNTCIRNDVDWIARYGGEEFIIILPNTDAESGAITANRIREAISQYKFVSDESYFQVSCSFGVSETYLDNDELNIEQLTNQADQALYKAKDKGRNRVEIFYQTKL